MESPIPSLATLDLMYIPLLEAPEPLSPFGSGKILREEGLW
jgi:hypothetical protein